MRTRDLIVYAVSSVLAVLLIVFALYGGNWHRTVNFFAPPTWGD